MSTLNQPENSFQGQGNEVLLRGLDDHCRSCDHLVLCSSLCFFLHQLVRISYPIEWEFAFLCQSTGTYIQILYKDPLKNHQKTLSGGQNIPDFGLGLV